jgi:hypothetical protein
MVHSPSVDSAGTDADSPEVPLAVRKATAAFTEMLSKNRGILRSLLTEGDGPRQLRSQTVLALRQHAVDAPNARALAEMLAATVPTSFVSAEAMSHLTGQDSTKLLKQTTAEPERTTRIRATVVEAALVEQQLPDGTFRNGSSFSAARLEEVMDSWLFRGRHRGAEFDNAPLSQIARTMDLQGWTADELIAARFGILLPVVVPIHIWRTVEEYSPENALLVGWRDDPQDGAAGAMPVPGSSNS